MRGHCIYLTGLGLVRKSFYRAPPASKRILFTAIMTKTVDNCDLYKKAKIQLSDNK